MSLRYTPPGTSVSDRLYYIISYFGDGKHLSLFSHVDRLRTPGLNILLSIKERSSNHKRLFLAPSSVFLFISPSILHYIPLSSFPLAHSFPLSFTLSLSLVPLFLLVSVALRVLPLVCMAGCRGRQAGVRRHCVSPVPSDWLLGWSYTLCHYHSFSLFVILLPFFHCFFPVILQRILSHFFTVFL